MKRSTFDIASLFSRLTGKANRRGTGRSGLSSGSGEAPEANPTAYDESFRGAFDEGSMTDHDRTEGIEGLEGLTPGDRAGLDNGSRRRRKRIVLALSAALVFGGTCILFANTNERTPGVVKAKDAGTQTLDLTLRPERLERRKYVMDLEERIAELTSAVGRLSTEVQEAKKTMKRLEAEGVHPADANADPLLTTSENGSGLPATGTLPPVPGAATVDAPLPPERIPQIGLFLVSEPPKISEDEKPQASAKPRGIPTLYETPMAQNRAGGTRAGDYLPASSFVSARLMTGGYVGTGAGANLTPIPVVMRVEEPVTLPNQMETDLTGCFLSGNATGDISAERIHIRLDRLSCVAPSGETLDMRVQGWIVDDAGMEGLKGTLIERNGAAMANALTTSLLSGIGRAVSLSSQSTTTSTLTGTQTQQVQNAWKSGLGEGVSDAFEKIADYYLELADRIFPVLEITPGQRVDVVFSVGSIIRKTAP